MVSLPTRLVLPTLCTAFALAPTGAPASPHAGLTDEGDAPTEAAEAHGADALLECVVVVGASVSDGFGLSRELEVEAGLELFLDAAWVRPRPAAANLASARFFLDPRGTGERQRDAALEREPSLLVAVDYLFWFGYGAVHSKDQRLALLEIGLALLDSIDAPMLVGDFPDMSPALEGKGPFGMPVISENQIPSPETLAALNARVDAWARERPRVVRVPLADFVTRIQQGREIGVRELHWTGEAAAALLQPDLLHASAEGTAALAMLVLDALERARDELGPDDVRWSTATVLEGVRTATAEARTEARRRRERAEEARRRREQRREREEEGDEPPDDDERSDDDERADAGVQDAA